jgi:hypothetical protein
LQDGRLLLKFSDGARKTVSLGLGGKEHFFDPRAFIGFEMPALYIAKASRDKLAISGMEKIEAYDQTENVADLAMPTDQNRIVTFESNRRKKS